MHIIAVAATSLLALAATVVGQLHIDTVALSECQPNLVTYGGGTPPYIVSAFPPGQTTGNALVIISSTATGTSLTWDTNLPAGESITLGIKDTTGASQFSGLITIASGSDSCLNSSSVSVSAGPTGASTTSPVASTTGASGVTSAPSNTVSVSTSPASSGAASGAKTTSAAPSSSTSAKPNSAVSLSAGPAAIFGMILGAFLA